MLDPRNNSKKCCDVLRAVEEGRAAARAGLKGARFSKIAGPEVLRRYGHEPNARNRTNHLRSSQVTPKSIFEAKIFLRPGYPDNNSRSVAALRSVALCCTVAWVSGR